MANMKTAVKETLYHPVLVIQSSSDKTATLNYRYLGTKVGDKWLCVVVKDELKDRHII